MQSANPRRHSQALDDTLTRCNHGTQYITSNSALTLGKYHGKYPLCLSIYSLKTPKSHTMLFPHDFSTPFAAPFIAGSPCDLLLLTTRSPATNKINASKPKITASVTIAPMTPATALDTPPPPLDGVGVAEGADPLPSVADAGAHTPVEFPHAWHHCAWFETANLLIPAAKSLNDSATLLCPNSG